MQIRTLNSLVFLTLVMVTSLVSAQKLEDSATSFIDDPDIKRRLFSQGNAILESGEAVSGETLQEQLASVPQSVPLSLPSQEKVDDTVFSNCYRSTLVVGRLYNCGRCNKTHLSTAGAVALSEDGLVLTNHHVIESDNSYNFVVMDHEGEVYPVTEVVAADEGADLAIVRVDAKNLRPAPLAGANPQAMTDLFVISHPHERFFLTTTGIVSRYSMDRKRKSKRAHWMEITAVFSQGSSGCGVFSREGDLIGLVSRKDTVYSKSPDGEKEQNMVIRRCVPISAIHDMIQQPSR